MIKILMIIITIVVIAVLLFIRGVGLSKLNYDRQLTDEEQVVFMKKIHDHQ